MAITRREFTVRSGLALAAAAAPSVAFSAGFPDKPIRFIVPFAASGNVDLMARMVGPDMAQTLGQPVVIENKTGAGGSIGGDAVAHAPADGYVLLLGSNGPLTVNPFVQLHMPYDPLKDLTAIGMIGYAPHALTINSNIPARTLQELIQLSKTRPINTGTAGVGSATHLTLQRLNTATGANFVHVPYRGGGAVTADLMGGTLDAAMTEFSTVLPLSKTGKVRIIAIAADHRSPLAPDVATMDESGVKGFLAASYVGVLAPAGTPAPIIATLQKALAKSLANTVTADKIKATGGEVAPAKLQTAEGFNQFLKEEYQRSKEAARLAGIKPE